MTDRTVSRLALGVYAISVGLVIGAVSLGLSGGRPGIDDPDGGTNLTVGLASGVGTVVVGRIPLLEPVA